MPEEVLDITPDPKVLIALTHTPLKPLDALCELIDNGIDAFRTAALQGELLIGLGQAPGCPTSCCRR